MSIVLDFFLLVLWIIFILFVVFCCCCSNVFCYNKLLRARISFLLLLESILDYVKSHTKLQRWLILTHKTMNDKLNEENKTTNKLPSNHTQHAEFTHNQSFVRKKNEHTHTHTLIWLASERVRKRERDRSCKKAIWMFVNVSFWFFQHFIRAKQAHFIVTQMRREQKKKQQQQKQEQKQQ